MSSLPPDIDFIADKAASPERMNRAMAYLYALIKVASALQPEFQTALSDLQTTGLQRLNDTLTPLVLQAQSDVATLDQQVADWTSGNVLTTLQATIEGEFNPQIAALLAALALAAPVGGGIGQMLTASGDPAQPNAWVDPFTFDQAAAERWFHLRG